MRFVFDLDGTICFKGQPISYKLIEALKRLQKQGHQIIFASARPIRDMLPVICEQFHREIMIGGNGALISVQGKVIHSAAFPMEIIEQIRHLIEKFEATYLIDSEWDYAYTGPHNHPILQNLDIKQLAKRVTVDSLTSIVKVLILTSIDNEQLAEALSELDVYVNKHSNEHIIDISPKCIHKWSALKMLGIKRGDFIAFGNDANDITLFENALHSVMIGYHDQLAYVAKESINEQTDIEQRIVEKLYELSDKYTTTKT